MLFASVRGIGLAGLILLLGSASAAAQRMDCFDFFAAIEQKSKVVQEAEDKVMQLTIALSPNDPKVCELARTAIKASDELLKLATENKSRCDQGVTKGEFEMRVGLSY